MTKIKFAKPQYLYKKYLFKLRHAIIYVFKKIINIKPNITLMPLCQKLCRNHT